MTQVCASCAWAGQALTSEMQRRALESSHSGKGTGRQAPESWVYTHILNDSINERRDGLQMLRGWPEVAQWVSSRAKSRSLGSLSPFSLNYLVSAYPPPIRLKKCVSTTTLGGWGGTDGGVGMVQLIQCLSSMHNSSPNKPGMLIHSCNPTIQEMEVSKSINNSRSSSVT